MDALVEKVHSYLEMEQDSADPMVRTTKRKIKDEVKEKDYELISLLPSET